MNLSRFLTYLRSIYSSIIRSVKELINNQRDRRYFGSNGRIVELNLVNRSNVFFIVFTAFIFTFIFRLYDIQVYSHQFYRDQATNLNTYTEVIPVVRGSIYDRNGVPLVTNSTNIVLMANRNIILKNMSGITFISNIFNMKREKIIDKLTMCKEHKPDECWNGSPYQPIPLYDHLSQKQAMQIVDHLYELQGVYILTFYDRVQTANNLNISQLTGYISSTLAKNDNNFDTLKDIQRSSPNFFYFGKNGLEGYYDTQLRGRYGKYFVYTDGTGRVIKKDKVVEPVNGLSLVSSIDIDLQNKVTYELNSAIIRDRQRSDEDNGGKRFVADSGAAIVMNIHTGDILAMVSYPQYGNLWDPIKRSLNTSLYNNLLRDKGKPLINRAYMSAFPPGSTFKAITTTAMGNAGYNLNSSYLCSSDFTANGSKFNNYHRKDMGNITLKTAIDVSCNTVFYRAGYEMWKKDQQKGDRQSKNEYLPETSKSYGFDRKTGLDLPGENPGNILDNKKKLDKWKQNRDKWCNLADRYKNDISISKSRRIALTNKNRNLCLNGYKFTSADAISEAVGQSGITVTPIQLTQAYAAIGNGGTVWQPNLIRAFTNSSGDITANQPKSTSRVKATPATMSFLQDALRSVSQQGTSSGYLSQSKLNGMIVSSKTGTAEVAGKSSQGWLATYNSDYAVLMTITQGGGGAASTGEAVSNIYRYLAGKKY